MDEILCALAYPTFVMCSAMWYTLLRWSSTCWCEQMRGTPASNRVVIVPLHSPRRLDTMVNIQCFGHGIWKTKFE